MMDIPDWFWQGVVTNIVADAFGLAVWLAYRNREHLRDRLGDFTASMTPASLNAEGRTVYISAMGEGTSSAHATITVGTDADLRWNVEAPTPSLARRLEELAAWYLHVS